MNKIITDNKATAAENLEIRRELIAAMGANGWRLRDNGFPTDINLGVLEARGALGAEVPFWFIRGGEVWRWEAFNAARSELEREGDGTRLHCIDLAVELLGENAVAEKIEAVLGLNEFGFRTDDLFDKGRLKRGQLARAMREYGGPWIAHKTKGVSGEGIRMLYRYDRNHGVYRYVGSEDMIELCRRIDSDRILAADCHGIDLEVMTHSETPVRTEFYMNRIPVRGGRLLDIRTMKTIECDESYFVTGCLNARWDETPEMVHRTYSTAGGKMALRLLNGIEDVQDRKVFLQYLGYTLTPGFHLKKFMIVYGNPHSGKSTLMRAWTQGVCPEEMCTGFDPNVAFGDGEGSRFGLEGLVGKRVAYCDEWGSYRLSDKGPLKTVVSGNEVDIDFKGKVRRTVKTTCKLIAGTNIIPSVQDNSGAFNERLIILDLSRDPFDPEVSPNFVPWFKNEDFCTVLLREAVLALNNQEDACWRCEAEEWYVAKLAEPSKKSRDLLKKVRSESCRCLDIIAAMLTDEESDGLLGSCWCDRWPEYENMYKRIHGSDPKTTGVDYLNSVLEASAIGGKHYQFDKNGTFRLPGDTVVSRRGLFYETSRDRSENGANKRKAGLWNIFKKDCNGNEPQFRQWLENKGAGKGVEDCLADVHEIETELARLKSNPDVEIAVG